MNLSLTVVPNKNWLLNTGLNSGLPVTTNVVVGGDAEDVRPFGDLTKSGKMVNAYNALIMAHQLSK